MTTIRADKRDGKLQIFMNELLFLHLQLSDFIGLVSHIAVDKNVFYITIYVKGSAPIVLELLVRERWEEVLRSLWRNL